MDLTGKKSREVKEASCVMQKGIIQFASDFIVGRQTRVTADIDARVAHGLLTITRPPGGTPCSLKYR